MGAPRGQLGTGTHRPSARAEWVQAWRGQMRPWAGRKAPNLEPPGSVLAASPAAWASTATKQSVFAENSTPGEISWERPGPGMMGQHGAPYAPKASSRGSTSAKGKGNKARPSTLQPLIRSLGARVLGRQSVTPPRTPRSPRKVCLQMPPPQTLLGHLGHL